MTSMFQVLLLILLLPTSSATLLLVLPAEMLLQGLSLSFSLSLSVTSIKFFFFFFSPLRKSCWQSSLYRKFRNTDIASSLLKFAPESCAVYVISKGKVHTIRPAGSPQTPTGAVAASPRHRSQKGLLHSTLPPNTHDHEDTNRYF